MEINNELKTIEAEMRSLHARKDVLLNMENTARSKQWAKDNGVTLDQIQLSQGEGMPYFMDLYSFSAWNLTNPIKKKFFEWNKKVYPWEGFLKINRLLDTLTCNLGDVT